MSKLLIILSGFATALLFLGVATPASARYEELEEPRVAYRTGYPADAVAAVHAALGHPDSKFLGGHALNASTSLRYAGDARALSLMLEALVKCPGVTVHVSFKNPDADGGGYDWRIAHMARTNRFQVEVNLSSERLKMEELHLPAHTGPELKG